MLLTYKPKSRHLLLYVLYMQCHCASCIVLGAGCVIVKNRRRLCGTGAALANAPIVQDKSYFEVKIQTGGIHIIRLCAHAHGHKCYMELQTD